MSGGNVKSQAINGIWLIIVIGAVVAFARVNGITNFESGYDYFKSWSDKANECANANVESMSSEERELKGCGSVDADGNPVEVSPPGSGGGQDSSPISISGPKEKQVEDLKNVIVGEPEDVEYSRSEWSHWSDLDKNGCDAREDTLIKQGKNVKTDPGTCKILSGEWVDPYSDKEITNSSSIDIDHIIPLSYAAQHGGQKWSSEKKELFANDPMNLIISSASENRKKGDRGPAEYMPPKKDFQCAYSSLWMQMVKKYSLTISKDDKAVLTNGLESCA